MVPYNKNLNPKGSHGVLFRKDENINYLSTISEEKQRK
jgi:hypothetical protein